MVPGFNHNVRHAGKPYHVQTEDSGVASPRITTHLFVGGNIIASKTTSYAHLVGTDDLAKVVRGLMEEQHKAMLRELVRGAYDEVDAAYGEKARAYQPGQLADAAARAPAARPPPAAAPAAAVAQPPDALPPAARAPSASPARAGLAPPPLPPRGRVDRAPPRRTAAPALTPPPVLRRYGGAGTVVVPSRPAAPDGATNAAAADAHVAAGRPSAAPARAAAPRPPRGGDEPLDSLLAGEGASEKSLDEVILSYLAEDPRDRK
jgi:hypothetical protein